MKFSPLSTFGIPLESENDTSILIDCFIRSSSVDDDKERICNTQLIIMMIRILNNERNITIIARLKKLFRTLYTLNAQ